MNHRNASMDCPTSSTASVFRHRGQDGPLLAMVTKFCCSRMGVRGWSQRREDGLPWLTAIEAGIPSIARSGAHEYLMVCTSERTGSFERRAEIGVCPERLLCAQIRPESANQKKVANPRHHDVAWEHTTVAPITRRVDTVPRLVLVRRTIAEFGHLSEWSCAAAFCGCPRRNRIPHRRGTAANPARMRAAFSSSRTSGIERGWPFV